MKLTPPKSTLRGASVSKNETLGFPDGSLITYEHEGAMLLGAVLKFGKQKYVILNERGRELELAANRLHAVPGRIPIDATTLSQKSGFLAALGAQARTRAENLDISELWGIVRSEDRNLSNKELSELLIGGTVSDKSTLDYLSLRFALATDRIYFKREHDGFLPRSESTVEDLKHAEKVREEKLRLRDSLVAWVKERRSGTKSEVPQELENWVTLLEEVAANAPHIDNAHQREARELVDYCTEALGVEVHGNRENRALSLLRYARHFSDQTNLALLRHRPPRRFSASARAEADGLIIAENLEGYPECDRNLRLDLTALSSFTIDDVTTKDMDDALSLERTRDGYRLGIHISDVAAMIPVGSELDLSARERATSLYLPDQTIHMLPEALSEDKLSLCEGKVRPTLSCLVTLSDQLHVLSAEIRPSLIRSTRRYTYDQVEELLEHGGSQELSLLYQLAGSLEQERLERGAQKVFKRDLVIDVRDDGSFALREIDEHGPARGLVGEMMVLANSLLARYAVQHGLPAVFRRQEPPEEAEGGTGGVPLGPAADYAGRAKLKKSTVALEPGPHSGLGLEAYLQATSPIRRYVDLLNQRQVLSHLRTKKPFYSRQELEQLALGTEEPLSTALSINKETRRFWLYRYLRRRVEQGGDAGRVITATVLRTDLKSPLVELDEVFMPTLLKSPVPLTPGDKLTLRIVSVEPQQDYLRLELVEKKPSA